MEILLFYVILILYKYHLKKPLRLLGSYLFLPTAQDFISGPPFRPSKTASVPG
jgi:hypothetical protein